MSDGVAAAACALPSVSCRSSSVFDPHRAFIAVDKVLNLWSGGVVVLQAVGGDLPLLWLLSVVARVAVPIDILLEVGGRLTRRRLKCVFILSPLLLVEVFVVLYHVFVNLLQKIRVIHEFKFRTWLH